MGKPPTTAEDRRCMVAADSKALARQRARWQGRANVKRFAEQIDEAPAAQRLKNSIETNVVERFTVGRSVLDVGIGTGRVSVPLFGHGSRLTGVDASAAMIERCAEDPRSAEVRLVKAELEELPFAAEAFDTVISVDTFVHFPDWESNLDEMLRVTRAGGRIIVDVGSSDHIAAVAQSRGCTADEVQAAELGSREAYVLRLSSRQLYDYAARRDISLVALVPYGAFCGSLVPNYWISESYAYRSGAIDRLVSWTGADPLLFTCAEFIERRVVAELPAATSGRMYAIFERTSRVGQRREMMRESMPGQPAEISDAWRFEFEEHALHEPNRAFAVAFLLAAWPQRLPATVRETLPLPFLHELERMERASHIDDICAGVSSAWRASAADVSYHGVALSDVFETLLYGELRERLESSE